MSEHDLRVAPARPHQRLTEDGRRMREVLSYSRRGSRFTPSQQEAWDAHADAWVVPDHEVDRAGVDVRTWFGREAPLVVEIGCGVGEATGVLAAARPDVNVLALEVWRPGVAASLAEVAAAGADNVRFCSVDAAWCLEHLVPEGGLAELWTFFPDPWPKTRHHKRRLVSPAFASVVAARLRAAGSGAWPPTGPTMPSRCSRCSTPSRPSRAAGAAVAGPAGHEVRAQGARGRPRDHRSRLPQAVIRLDLDEVRPICQDVQVAPAGRRGAAHLDY